MLAPPRPARRYRRALLPALVLLLAACGGPAAAPPATPTVTMVVASRQLNVSHEMGDGFTAGVTQVPGVQSAVTGPDVTDGPAAVHIFEDVARSRPAGVSIFTLTPELFAEPMAAAARAGIPMIAVDNPPPSTAAVPLFVGNDNRELGHQLARLVVAQLDPKPTTGTVVLGTPVPGAPVLDQRAQGMRAEFSRLLPGVAVLGPFDSRLEEEVNLQAWRVLVAANPDAVAFVGTGDSDTVNLGRIHRETGGRWIAAGFDLDPRSLEAVRQGDVVLISPEHFLEGAVAGRLQAEHAAGRTTLPQGWVFIPGLAVDRSNVEQIIERQRSDEAKQRALQGQLDAMIADLPAHTRPLGTG